MRKKKDPTEMMRVRNKTEIALWCIGKMYQRSLRTGLEYKAAALRDRLASDDLDSEEYTQAMQDLAGCVARIKELSKALGEPTE